MPGFGVAGYKVYYGTVSRVYGSPINVGNVTTYTFDLSPAQRYFIAVTAYNQFGESGYSNELNAVGLTTSVNPPGVGTINPPGVTWYNSGQSVSVSATANPGYTFNGWSGDFSGSTNPSSVVMNRPKNVTANFTQNQYTLTVSIVPVGAGSVAKNPDKATYVHGETVQLICHKQYRLYLQQLERGAERLEQHSNDNHGRQQKCNGQFHSGQLYS